GVVWQRGGGDEVRRSRLRLVAAEGGTMWMKMMRVVVSAVGVTAVVAARWRNRQLGRPPGKEIARKTPRPRESGPGIREMEGAGTFYNGKVESNCV
ncbi:hypothetical protein Tco_1117887, partial [Tanacetum coccineum]